MSIFCLSIFFFKLGTKKKEEFQQTIKENSKDFIWV